MPLDILKARCATADPPRDFRGAIAAPPPDGIHLIAEIKRRSPSAGLIRPDFDPAAIARVYWQSGATAISVLTDGPYFDGRLEYLVEVRDAAPLPVLRKDFILEEYQVWESRAAYADAILLIAEVLGPERVAELNAVCAALGMTALIETYRPNLLAGVIEALGRPLPSNVLIGINNRDLTIQKTDVGTTERLAATLDDTAILVSESGISTRQDVLRVQEAGAAAMLVGESLLAAPDIAAQVHELLGRTT